ncbi:MAG: hypothetical protein RH917_09170 [Lacipirellulaceae bacterium]
MRRQLVAYGELFCFLAAWTAGLLATIGAASSDAPQEARSASVAPAESANDVSYE